MSVTRVTIESLAHGGDAVAHLPDGRTAFVRGACPGDEADIAITEEHGRWVRARIDTIVVPSPDRVAPPCPYFGECGGCQWQHVAYPRQLEAKRASVFDALERIGKVTAPEVAPTVPSPFEYGYRNKIELTAKTTERGLVLGFARLGTNDILPVDQCLLLPNRQQRAPKAVAGALRFLSGRGALGVVRVVFRVGRTGDIACDLWTHPGPFPRAAVAKVIAEAVGARTITRVIVRGAVESRDISNVEVLAGPGAWSEVLGDDRYIVSAPSFFQVNSAAAEDLRRRTIDALAADGTMAVADLYAGVGTFTLPLARSAGAVIAVESSRFALADLRRNLDQAGLDAEIEPGDAARALPDLGHLDAAVIDPPRSGLSDEAIRALESARIARIVYVSCDPATLARDVKRLCSAGYGLTRAEPVDLFPQTYHVESVATMERI